MKVYLVIDQGGRSWSVCMFLRRLYHRLRYGTWETVPWGNRGPCNACYKGRMVIDVQGEVNSPGELVCDYVLESYRRGVSQ